MKLVKERQKDLNVLDGKVRVYEYELKLQGEWMVNVSALLPPPDGHGEGFSWAGTWTDDLWPQTFTLEDIEERVTWWDGPCREREREHYVL